MNELIRVLDEERHALEELLFRLLGVRGLMTGGEARFLVRASDEIDATIQHIHDLEQRREQLIDRLATELGCRARDLTMRRLMELAEEPFRSYLGKLHDEFLALTDELEDVTATNRELADRANRQLEQLLRELTSSSEPAAEIVTYGPDAARRVQVAPIGRRHGDL